MRFGAFGFDRQFGFSAATQGGGAAPAPPPELFPDPTLADVADDTNGWFFVDGAPFFGPTGGTGPGITSDTDFETSGNLVGDDETAFAAAVANSSTKTVALTVTGAAEGCSASVQIKGGTPVVFNFDGPDTFIQSVTAGTTTTTGFVFVLTKLEGPDTLFNITAVSVT